MKSAKSSFLLVAIILFSAALAQAKPAPPQALTTILKPLAELEESFEEGEWSEGVELSEEISGRLNTVFAKHAGDIPAIYNDRLIVLSAKLESALKAKDEDAAEEHYLNLQMFTFEVMDAFDYKVHPIFVTLRTYIVDEAREAAAEGDFDDVLTEMREAASFFKKTSLMLGKHGVKKESIKTFHTTIKSAMEQAEQKDKAALEKSLHQLQVLIDVFQKSFI